MKTMADLLTAFVHWLRRPQCFIQKLQAIYPQYHTLPFHNQDEIAAKHGVAIVETTLRPTVEGIITRDDGYVLMAIRRGLNPLNRQFAIVHEFGHFHLHLSELKKAERQVAFVPRDHRDVEADAFAIKRLVGSLPKERLAPELFLYVLSNQEMGRRAVRVVCYMAWYHQRIALANILERVLIARQAKGTA